MDEHERIINYLVQNREHICTLLSDLDKQRDELLIKHPELTRDIKDQFKYHREMVIMNDLKDNLTADFHVAKMIIGSMDLNKYLDPDIIDVK